MGTAWDCTQCSLVFTSSELNSCHSPSHNNIITRSGCGGSNLLASQLSLPELACSRRQPNQTLFKLLTLKCQLFPSENDLRPGDQHFSTNGLTVAQDNQNTQREENPICLHHVPVQTAPGDLIAWADKQWDTEHKHSHCTLASMSVPQHIGAPLYAPHQ